MLETPSHKAAKTRVNAVKAQLLIISPADFNHRR